ncbi:uncharacterized protein EDB91DRAFT_1056615 [Suillus paluster]|uniref:uncharacterized protein n=1 Tax=Suillus paluster TaxID=48578 RepID=UPI001B85D972|nr:uncharacterized protein EDB91DRAFT_1056615 [Suillus paluster]KAG1734926.1 hypothetical protein EDB91DRAFT_1056615 [Suillus paluster]
MCNTFYATSYRPHSIPTGTHKIELDEEVDSDETVEELRQKPQNPVLLPRISTRCRAARLIATALATVYNDYILVAEDFQWDENDDALTMNIAEHIDAGEYNLDILKWPWNGYRNWPDGTNKTQQFVKNAALLALKDGENVDDVHMAQLDDDRAYLISFLSLDNEASPLSHYFNF